MGASAFTQHIKKIILSQNITLPDETWNAIAGIWEVVDIKRKRLFLNQNRLRNISILLLMGFNGYITLMNITEKPPLYFPTLILFPVCWILFYFNRPQSTILKH